MPNPRAARVADRIHRIVASAINGRLKDPRLARVTITEVRVTGDLQQASIFYTVYGGEKAQEVAAAGLESAKGLLRAKVGEQLGLRLVPTLEFVPDALPETAKSLEAALQAAREHDAQVRKLAASAQPAGDADPYRRPLNTDAVDAEPEEDFDVPPSAPLG